MNEPLRLGFVQDYEDMPQFNQDGTITMVCKSTLSNEDTTALIQTFKEDKILYCEFGSRAEILKVKRGKVSEALVAMLATDESRICVRIAKIEPMRTSGYWEIIVQPTGPMASAFIGLVKDHDVKFCSVAVGDGATNKLYRFDVLSAKQQADIIDPRDKTQHVSLTSDIRDAASYATEPTEDCEHKTHMLPHYIWLGTALPVELDDLNNLALMDYVYRNLVELGGSALNAFKTKGGTILVYCPDTGLHFAGYATIDWLSETGHERNCTGDGIVGKMAVVFASNCNSYDISDLKRMAERIKTVPKIKVYPGICLDANKLLHEI